MKKEKSPKKPFETMSLDEQAMTIAEKRKMLDMLEATSEKTAFDDIPTNTLLLISYKCGVATEQLKNPYQRHILMQLSVAAKHAADLRSGFTGIFGDTLLDGPGAL
jgi:hypothetical protein